MSEPAVEVVRWYTRGRRFPQLIGRTPDGKRIPGGPYTFPQVITAGLVLLVGVKTTGLWARYGLIGNGLVLAGVTYGLVLAVGRIPVGSRNPLAVLAGGVHALTAPPAGRLAGRGVRAGRPRRVQHRIDVLPVVQAAGDAGCQGAVAGSDPEASAAAAVGDSAARVGKASDTCTVGVAGATPPSPPPVAPPPPAGGALGPPASAAARPAPAARPALSGVQALLAATVEARR